MVLSAMERQVDCYRRLVKLAAVQHDHVQNGRTEALLEVLEARQRVLDEIGMLEETIAPARREWRKFAQSLDEDLRSRAQSLLKEMRGLLEKIVAADRDDTMVLQQQKLSVGRQIGQAVAARSASRGYAAAAYGTTSRGRIDAES
mgnify:CR=1 FL=1